MSAFQEEPSSEKVCTDSPANPPIVMEHEDVSSTPAGELMVFRGLSVKQKKLLLHCLMKVCSWHPSLIEFQKKRSHMSTDWAFTASAQLLHFLKNTEKVKDMTDDLLAPKTFMGGA